MHHRASQPYQNPIASGSPHITLRDTAHHKPHITSVDEHVAKGNETGRWEDRVVKKNEADERNEMY